MELPGIVSRTRSDAVVLTFDACGGPGGSRYDAALIALLRRLGVPATLFVNARWTAANGAVAAELAADPLFELASHGLRHVPISVTGRSAYGIPGTRNAGEVYDEVTGADPWFGSVLGHRPRWFRPGTAHSDDVAAAIALALGTPVVGFSVNADAGATLPPGEVAAGVRSARSGDIVISHFNQPGHGTAAGYAQALPSLLGSGTSFTTLARALA